MKKYLIVGLGNIGEEYKYTRHNIGFLALDRLASEQGCSFSPQRLADVAEFKHKGRTFVLVKPSTYMNLSGKAVRYWAEKENIPTENILVITDDLNLPFATLRLKKQGSDGGHNGLKSVQEELKTNVYPRLRFGISAEFSRGGQVDYVLGKWTEEEILAMPKILEIISQAVLSFGLSGINITMNQFNKKIVVE